MFFVIWGFKTYTATLGMVTLACRNGHTAAHRLVRTTRKFTLFFIPLFPVRHRYYSVCTMCGQQVAWSKEEAQAMASQAGAPGIAQAPFDPVSAPVNPYQPPVPVPSNPPAGWYQDPSGQPQQRWWDGRGWTETVRELAPPR
jgi:hypothetical protein